MKYNGRWSGRVQWWLQTRKRYFPAIWLGNGLSAIRYWIWRLVDGT